ncbi:MAG: hypothetical protein IPF54_14575 [Draconibacterium sp.]|nr:hypothetical protein [Draconibacterium sp.]
MYTAVPVSVPVFIELNSFKTMPFDSPLFEKWTDVEKISGFKLWGEKLDSIIRKNGDIQNGLRSDRFIVALGLMGDKSLTPLVIQKAESSGRQKSIETLSRVLFPEPEFTYTEIDYTGYKITSAITIDSKKSFHYCFTDGLVIASSNLVLVQQSLLQLSEPGITKNPSFEKITKSMGSEPDVAFYVNQQLFPDFLLEFVNSSSIEEANEFGENVKRNHYRNVRDFKRFSSWNEFEAEFNDNDILFKGITVANDSTNDFLSVFHGQEPQRSGAGEILPANTSYYTSYTFSNKKLFFDKLEKYFSLAGSFYKREDLIGKMESDLRIGFKKTFQSMIKSEMIIAVTDIPTETSNKTSYFIFDVNGKSKTENILDSMLLNYANRKNLLPDDFKTVYSLNEKKEFTIYEFPFPSFPGIWLGKPFYSAQAKYAVFYKDFLVFCNTSNGLQNYLQNMDEGEHLSSENRFDRAKNNVNGKSNISSYFNMGRILNLSDELLSSDLSKKLEKKKSVLRKLQAVYWQIGGGKEVFNNEINLIFDDGKPEEENKNEIGGVSGTMQDSGDSQTVWQCNIGNQIITKPVFTINHSEKEFREVMVQDKSNKLHQISHDGKIRWSIDIGEPIMSEVYQIDYLANGKLQYLFSTKTKLFIVDRNGVNLEGFPVVFPAKATNGVSVLDYDNNRIYRYFIACEDKKVYAYDKEGKIMAGWVFEGTKSEVSTPIQHFRVKGKDYIVFKDRYRIYIQNRKGEAVAKTAAEFENSRNPLILSPGKTPNIIATDTKGTIYIIDFDGNYTEKKVGKFDDEHFFTADDLNGDNALEYVFVDGRELTIMNESGTVLFSQKFPNTIQNQPNIYRFGSKLKKIGIVDTKENRIYLFDANGNPHPGFPLQEATEFSIGKITQSSKT